MVNVRAQNFGPKACRFASRQRQDSFTIFIDLFFTYLHAARKLVMNLGVMNLKPGSDESKL